MRWRKAAFIRVDPSHQITQKLQQQPLLRSRRERTPPQHANSGHFPKKNGRRIYAFFWDLKSAAMAFRAEPCLNQLIWLSLKVWFTGNS